MWKVWLDYHRGLLLTAHELGRGCGVGAVRLMSTAKARDLPLKHMILSDPPGEQCETTRDMMPKRNQSTDVKFILYQSPGEDSFLESGSVEMVMACECLHCMDIRKAIAAIHARLRPGGTFARVHYTVPTMRIVGNERATEAFRPLLMAQHTKQAAVTAFNNRSVEMHQLGMGLNFVPLYKDMWEDADSDVV